ncbi:hypothetical protein PF010_g20881 [Phytophthora fragariae]|uniref:Uncharacterized protein n=1 Tax=Phytophthora fragariae TaxID=53985 RepID=A0A6A3S5U7_9STRA|nr:hypothetical protein PF003_g29976 [Phytophthora fragariae]KAE8926473.1 hypothetical protein PF009_g23338 [Phytophthora fragariae]KAE9081650.1 hypothetical protein PF007_g22577 [Phytophthora fragariae]KAE9084311.1 hypothetical protein PF010_g20881 [Phytophthora fragariae]KAE9109773.1 hypothetical protein PF006_g20598 [Phytophthora fragariae]
MEHQLGDPDSSFVGQLLAAQARSTETPAAKTHRKVYTYKRLGKFNSISEAKLFIDSLADGVYRHSYNSNSTHRVSTFLECTSHVDCESVIRIVRMRTEESCVVD